MDAPAGLIHALLLDGSGGAAPLAWERVQDWQPADGCLWLHFDYEEDGAASWLREYSGLNDIAVAGLLAEETRPRTISRGDNLLLTLRGVNLNPGAEPDDMVSLRIWTDGRRLISTRRRQLLSTVDVLERLDEGTGPSDMPQLLVEWIDRLLVRMSDTIDNLEDVVLALEERVLTDDRGGLRVDFAHLRKQTIVLRRYLAPQREAMNRLVGEPLGWLDEMNRLRLREAGDRLVRYIEDIDAVRERAAVAQEELQSRLSEQMNQRMYVLSIVAALFLPLGFFTGLMGINVGGMPGMDNGRAFWIVVLLCVSILVLVAGLFRLRRWL